MEKALDKINQAFKGELGKGIETKTRNRIYWMINNVKGKNILDIGCSQGITSILLGREGKKVIGVDALSKSIEIAKSELENEEVSTKENVKFINRDIINSEDLYIENGYETIILGEILEHFADGGSLLEKAYRLGGDECRYIITVPFGINDYFDHKKTYYYAKFYKEVDKYVDIEEVSFMGKWVGVIGKRKKQNKVIENNDNISFDFDLMCQLEQNFYKVERDLVESNKSSRALINEKNREIQKLNSEVVELNKEIKRLNEEMHMQMNNNMNVLKNTSTEINRVCNEDLLLIKDKINSYIQLNSNLKSEFNYVKSKFKSAKEELNDEVLNYRYKIKVLEDSNNKYEEENKKLKVIQNKYNKLSKSKLGSLTLKYWQFKRRNN